jgi:tRNA(Ile)-lysidine synthase
MALCVLLRQHQKEYGWPEDIVAYTIDHGVRTGSTVEAKTVGKMVRNHFGTSNCETKSCSDYSGFKHRILTLDKSLRKELEKEIPGNLEAVLRTERFQMLTDAAKEDKVDQILQGHHSDDQYETLLQRLAWGSTLAGLGGIAPSNGRFRRPLLGFSKVFTEW